MPRQRSDCQPDAELARTPTHRERQDARDADHGNCQRDGREGAEYQCVQPIRREHLCADVCQSRRALDRLVR